MDLSIYRVVSMSDMDLHPSTYLSFLYKQLQKKLEQEANKEGARGRSLIFPHIHYRSSRIASIYHHRRWVKQLIGEKLTLYMQGTRKTKQLLHYRLFTLYIVRFVSKKDAQNMTNVKSPGIAK